MSSDKLYVIIIIGMIGVFIYWYQTRLDLEAQNKNSKGKEDKVYCAGCKQRMIKRKDKHKSTHSDTDNRRPKSSTDKRKSKRRKDKKVRFKDDDSINSDDSIPDSIIEARLRSKSSKRGRQSDAESEISIESLDTADRSDASHSRRDDDTLDMVDGTIDSDVDTIDLD